MTDEKIIEYVMNSPENTNPSVLNSMLKSNKVQPDWNQNDESAADYIKNRPFYEEITEVVILPETRFMITEAQDTSVLALQFSHPLEIGKEYIVTLDGVTKTYTAATEARYEGRIIFITNTSIDEMNDGNGWAIGFEEESSALIFSSSDVSLYGMHTISISDKVTETHKINSKYIPTMALYKSYSVEPVSLSKTNLGEPLDPKELADLLKNYSCFVVDKFSTSPSPLPSLSYDYIKYMPISTFIEYYSYADLVAIECFSISNDDSGIIKYLNGVIPPS